MKIKPAYIIGGIALSGLAYVAYKQLSGRYISKKGIKFLIASEGFKNKMYRDSKGLPTIGVGHLIVLPQEQHLMTATLTNKQVEKLFHKDLDRFEKVVKDSIKVPLKQHQKDALVHFAFNVGEAGFKNSSLVKLINSKAPDKEIISAFSKWNKPSELTKRRAKEARLFLTGNYSNVISPVDYNKYFTA